MANQFTATIESIIMAALSTLTTSQLNSLSFSLSSTFRRHNHQLVSLLTSPALFTHTINHLYSLSLSQKSLLVARHLLSFLHLLTPFLYPSLSHNTKYVSSSSRVRHRDLDSVLLLLFFCEVRQHQPAALESVSPADWQGILKLYGSDTMLNNLCTGFAISLTPYQVLGTFVDLVIKCKRFVNTKGCANGIKAEKEVAASTEAVVALPSIESGGGVECVICKEEMIQGRDVCVIPCEHIFHWKCVLPWLSRRNTCPCCRFQLPTDDVYGEIQRLWDAIVKLGLTLES